MRNNLTPMGYGKGPVAKTESRSADYADHLTFASPSLR